MGVPYHANSLHQLHRTGVLRHSTALTDACPREVVVEQCLFLPRHCTEMHPDIPHGIQIFFFHSARILTHRLSAPGKALYSLQQGRS